MKKTVRPTGSVLWLLGAVLAVVMSGCSAPIAAPEAEPTVAAPTKMPTDPLETTATAEGLPTSPATLPAAPALIEIIDLGGPPAPGRHPMAVVAVGEWLYTANEGSSNLSAVRHGRVQAVLPLEPGPYRLVADESGSRLFVLAEASRSVVVVQEDRITDTWTLPENPTAGAVIADHLWVGTASGRLLRLRADSGRPAEGPETQLEAMILDLVPSGDDQVLAATYQDVILLDAASLQAQASRELPAFRTMTVSGARVYLVAYDAQAGQAVLHIWDAQDLAPLDSLPVPDDTSALWVDPRGERAWLTGNISNRLTLLDLTSGELLEERIVGLSPQGLAYDAAEERLAVSNYGSHTVALVSPDDLRLLAVVPLALEITALEAAPSASGLYIGLNTGQIVTGPAERLQAPSPAVYPAEMALVPALGQLAVLDQAASQLLLLNDEGAITQRQPTNPEPRGLYIDALPHTIYAGDMGYNWAEDTADTLQIPVGPADASPPIQVLRDTRRDRLYAVVWNGIPGSNSGYVVRSEGDGSWDESLPTFGRLSVLETVYDPSADAFYSTHAHMGQYGLQVTDGETLEDNHYVTLDRQPQAMVLNRDLWHLWLVLSGGSEDDAPDDTLLMALGTRSLSPVAQVRIDARIGRAALDPVSHRLYLAARDTGTIYVVQDVALPAPTPEQPATVPMPTATPDPKPEPQASPTTEAVPTPTSAPTAQPTVTVDPTATPSPTSEATPECGIPVAAELAHGWQAIDAARTDCPAAPAHRDTWGWQPFQNGVLFWRRDTGQIIAAFSDGTVALYTDSWHDGMPNAPCEADPPEGLWQPIRGFGLAWCEEPDLRERLGWAVEPEAPFLSSYQAFDGGLLFTHPEAGVVWLGHDNRWTQVTTTANP